MQKAFLIFCVGASSNWQPYCDVLGDRRYENGRTCGLLETSQSFLNAGMMNHSKAEGSQWAFSPSTSRTWPCVPMTLVQTNYQQSSHSRSKWWRHITIEKSGQYTNLYPTLCAENSCELQGLFVCIKGSHFPAIRTGSCSSLSLLFGVFSVLKNYPLSIMKSLRI